VAKGPIGSAFVAGSCVRGATTASDIVVARYSRTGKRLWLRHLAGPGDSVDYATDMVVDGAGNVYVCGVAWAYIPPPGDDGVASLLIAKYSAAGELKWSHVWADAFGGINSASALALAKGGGVCVAGTSTGMGTGTNMVLLRFDALGVQQWGGAARYVGPAGGVRAADVAVDAAGNSYVVGSGPDLSGDSDLILVKWDAAGLRQWDRLYDSGASADDYGSGVAVTSGGTTFVYGWIARTGDDIDWLLLGYGAGGDPGWAKTWGSPAHSADVPEAMAMGAGNTIYLTGYSYPGSYAKCVTRKYSAKGKLAWARTVAMDPGIRGESIAVTGTHVYIGGFTGGATWRSIVARYTVGGRLSWLKTWRAARGQDASVNDIAVAPGKALWVAGVAQRTGTAQDAYLQKRAP